MREKKTATQKTQVQKKGAQDSNRKTATERGTHIINIYKNISTEERIHMYLKICRYIEYGEKLQ